jgi:branched-chain amino acid transport system permease protein
VLAILACVVAVLAMPAPWASTAAAQGESIKGTLRDPGGKPVRGVSVAVRGDGAQDARARTAADGTWEIRVPGPGSYRVQLDAATLPDDVQMRTKGGETLPDVEVRPGQQRTVIFPLIAKAARQQSESSRSAPPAPGAASGSSGDDAARAQDGRRGFAGRFAQQTVEGIKYGMIIAITAIGLSLVFGTTRLINFAHGELVTIGAMVAFGLSGAAVGLPLIVAALLAIVLGGLLGGALELGLWRPMRRRGTGLIQLFIISIGLSLLLRHLLLVIFDSRRRQYEQFTVQDALDLGPVTITPRDLTITLVSAAVLLGVGFLLMRTRIGKATRAVANNKDLAEASGIDVNRVILVVWVLGGALAALGGVFYGLTTAVYWDMGFNLLLLMFAGVILGGLGSAFGAVVGSLVVGLVAQLSTLWFAVELQNAWALLTLIVVLLLRPQGILGRAERVG